MQQFGELLLAGSHPGNTLIFAHIGRKCKRISSGSLKIEEHLGVFLLFYPTALESILHFGAAVIESA